MRLRIALFGGSFDPVHNGHVEIAKAIVEDFKIDKFYFIPSNIPPHKPQHVAPNKDRLKMLLLVKDMLGNKYFVSDYEFRSERNSYTSETVQYFKERYPKDKLFFVVGSDIFATIKTWKRHREIFSVLRFIVVKRAGVTFEEMAMEIGPLYEDYLSEGSIILYDRDFPDISSSAVREGMFEGVVPDVIESYINIRGLY